MEFEKNEMENFKTIGRFLNNFTSYKTKNTYKSIIKKYFNFIDKNPDQYIRTDFRTLENGEKIKVQDNYENDITNFWNNLITNNRPPKTVQTSINIIRSLLQHYRITLDETFWKNLNRRGTGNEARTIDKPITREILEKILTQADIKSRALFLMLSSSGMRLGEVLQLTPNNINFNSKPTTITIRGEMTKNKTGRTVFISNEATKYLKLWLKERDQFLINAVKKTHIKTYHGMVTKDINDPTVFPFNTCNATCLWNNLIKKAGLTDKDELTGRRKYHIHGLRKYFRSYFSKQNRDIAELLMGHNGYLTKEYLRFTENEIEEQYNEGMKFLTVFEENYETDNEIIKQQRQQIEELQNQMDILMTHYKGTTE